MHVGNHRSDVASTQWRFSLWREFTLSDVLRDRLVPVFGVTLVDGEDLASGRNLHVVICQYELSYRLQKNTSIDQCLYEGCNNLIPLSRSHTHTHHDYTQAQYEASSMQIAFIINKV